MRLVLLACSVSLWGCPGGELLAVSAANLPKQDGEEFEKVTIWTRDTTPPGVSVEVGDELKATGYDPDSAISRISLRVSVVFYCTATIGGQPARWKVERAWRVDAGSRRPGGVETNPRTSVSTPIDEASLWERGQCDRSPHPAGHSRSVGSRRIEQVTGTYRATAVNNSQQAGVRRSTTTHGHFARHGDDTVRMP